MTSPEATPEDVHEQQAALVEVQEDDDEALPDEASEADVAEQRVEVSFDEEDAPIG
jgi:hypothetical protein